MKLEMTCVGPCWLHLLQKARDSAPFLHHYKLEENPVLKILPTEVLTAIKISYVQGACNRNIFKPTWLSVKIFRNQKTYSHNFKLKSR